MSQEEEKQEGSFVEELIQKTRMAMQSDIEITLRTSTNERKGETTVSIVSAKAI